MSPYNIIFVFWCRLLNYMQILSNSSYDNLFTVIYNAFIILIRVYKIAKDTEYS